MKNFRYHLSKWWLYVLITCALFCCNTPGVVPSKQLISEINLKRGDVISCGAPDNQFGAVDFQMTCTDKSKTDFNLAIALLHSFEYDESEKVFAKIIDEDAGCSMAYWGVAMCNFHALWTPPNEAELIKGSKAIAIAQSISNKSKRETAYINALAAFFKNWKTTDHLTRCVKYEKAMEKLHADYPRDTEAAIFYALALDASANPNDQPFANQKKAGAILKSLYVSEPNHPGVIHYIIHTYDYPGLADSALAEARRYAQVAPSSAHALHMPSHIFTRLGLWDECIQSNLASVAAAKCYADQSGIQGHWDEELHGLDYLVYAYLQKGENNFAEEQVKYLQTFAQVYPVNFKDAYAFAAIPARVCLENKQWSKAAAVQLYPGNFPWTKFPWQEAIIHFTRALGAAHIHNTSLATTEMERLQQLYNELQQQKDAYKTKQVQVQITAAKAWINFYSGKKHDAISEMSLAAAMEDSTQKHPVTPCEVLPARELLGDMFVEMKQYDSAYKSYQEVLQKCPNRFNSLYGAATSAQHMGNTQQAQLYYRKLEAISDAKQSNRPELITADRYLKSLQK